MRASLTLKPAMALSASARDTVASSRYSREGCKRSPAASRSTGKLPELPTDCDRGVVTNHLGGNHGRCLRNHGFHLARHDAAAGCSAAMQSRPVSQGPLFIQRRSLAIFMRLTAMTELSDNSLPCPARTASKNCDLGEGKTVDRQRPALDEQRPLAGLGEIALPALQPGTAIMPGKVNP